MSLTILYGEIYLLIVTILQKFTYNFRLLYWSVISRALFYFNTLDDLLIYNKN